jgi:hypothetical protein
MEGFAERYRIMLGTEHSDFKYYVLLFTYIPYDKGAYIKTPKLFWVVRHN